MWKFLSGIGNFLGKVFAFAFGFHAGGEYERKKNKQASDELKQGFDDIESNNPPDLERDLDRLLARSNKNNGDVS